MATLAFSRGSLTVLAIFLLFSCFGVHHLSEAFGNFPMPKPNVLKQKFSGSVVTEMKVNLPADELWAVYRSPQYLKLLANLQPDIYKSVIYINGNGRVDTIVQVTVSTKNGDEYTFEKITKIDDKSKTRVQTLLHGRILSSGFTSFASEYQVIGVGQSSSIIRYSLLFDLEKQSLRNVTLVVKTWNQAIVIADYVNSLRSRPVVLSKEFGGEMAADVQINLSAEDLWKEYRRLNFPKILLSIMPYFYKQIDFVGGKGEVGTRFNITLQPARGNLHYVEHNIMISDIAKTREIQFVEGGPLEFGLTKFLNAFIVMPKTRSSSVIRAFGVYTIKPESLFNVSGVQPIWDHAIAMSNYTLSQIGGRSWSM